MKTSAAERKRTERERRQQQGLVRVEVYVRPEDRQRVRDYAERLTARARLTRPA